MTWIKCTDRLPEFTVTLDFPHGTLKESQNVVCTDGREIWIGFYSELPGGKQKWEWTFVNSYKKPTHWMPLPELPKD